jgi:SHS2 domain-containing protein
VVEHTADQILEAWGPTRAACLEEAIAGFVATFASASPESGLRTTTLTLADGDHARLLLDLLGEVIWLLDTQDAVVVAAHIDDQDDCVQVHLDLVHTAVVEPAGPAPKGVSHSGLDLTSNEDGWMARALIDI